MGYYIEYAEHKREDKTLLAVFIELHDSLGLNRSERKRVARSAPPTTQDADTSYLSCIWEKLQVKGFSKDTIDIILNSWRDGTKSRYQSTAKKWFEFCEKNNCNAISTGLVLVWMASSTNLQMAGEECASVPRLMTVLDTKSVLASLRIQ